MTSRLLVKLRRLRRRSITLLVFVFTAVGFQNCAPPSTSSIGQTDAASTAATSGTTNASSTSGVSGFGSTTVSHSGSSGTTSGTTSGTSSGGFNTGSTTSGSSSSGSSGSSSSGSTSSTAFQIYQQPAGVTIQLGADFTLSVGVSGGTQPYTYQWYKDSAVVGNGLGSFYFLADQATTYNKEGNYYLKITDATGAILTSTTVRVGIIESVGACDAAQYMMFNQPSADPTNSFLPLFDNTHGKYLVIKSNPMVSFMTADSSYFKLSYFNFTPALQDSQTATISCATQIDRIHNRTPNPDVSSGSANSNNYSNSTYWQYQGAVTFACHNEMYKFVSDTCQWVQVKAYPNTTTTTTGRPIGSGR